jgi:hypothetical protein
MSMAMSISRVYVHVKGACPCPRCVPFQDVSVLSRDIQTVLRLTVTDNESIGQPACQEERKMCKEEEHE